MRLALLLLVLAVIGLSLVKMLNRSPPAPAMIQQEASSNPALPTVPTHPQALTAFERDMNRLIQDTAKQRADQENTQ